VSFAIVTLCVASHREFIFVIVYFVTDSVRKLLDTPSYDIKYVEILQFPTILNFTNGAMQSKSKVYFTLPQLFILH
jgi:hypothetical protein